MIAEITALEETEARAVGLANGDRIITVRLKVEENAVTVHSRFGSVRLRWAEIVSIDPVDNAQYVHPPPTHPLTADTPKNVDYAPGPIEMAKIEQSTTTADKIETPPIPARLNNQLTVDLSLIGNQTSSILAASKRDYVATARLSYTRFLENDVSIGIRMPLSYEMVTSSDDPGRTSTAAGLGDLSVFADKTFNLGDGWPRVQITATGWLPTGRTNGPQETTLAGLSSGNWGLGIDAVFLVPVDFGAFFGGIGYNQFWPLNSYAAGYSSNREINWLVGYVINLNDKWKMANTVTGAISRSSISRREPAYLSIGLSYTTDNYYTIRPTFSHGLNSDAQDFIISLGVSRQW